MENSSMEASTSFYDDITVSEETTKQQQSLFDSRRPAMIYIGTGVVGFIGNVFVVIVMLSSPSVRKKIPNMYIIHQSVIDALVSVALMGTARIPPSPSYHGILGYLDCLVWQSKLILWVLLLCSTYNLVVLTIERYIEIVFPIYHKVSFSRTKATLSLVSVWVFSIAFELAGKTPPTYTENGQCHFIARWPSHTARRVYGIWVVIVKFFLPLIVLIYCYGHIAVMLQKRIENAPSNGPQTAAERSRNAQVARLQKGKRNTVKTLALVATAFVLCWSCNQFYFLFYNIGYNLSLKSDFYHFSVIMNFVNSCINPIIYVFKFEQFQEATKRLFSIIFRKYRPNQVAPAAEITLATVN